MSSCKGAKSFYPSTIPAGENYSAHPRTFSVKARCPF